MAEEILETTSEVAEETVDIQERPKDEPKKERTFTREDISKMFAAERAKWEEERQKQEDEAKKLAKMNAEEKAKHELDKVKAELEGLRLEKSLSDMKTNARAMLSEVNINASDELLNVLVHKEAEATKQAVKSFTELFKQHVEAEVTERLKSNTPKRGTSGSTALTKQEILSITDRTERLRLIEENAGLFI